MATPASGRVDHEPATEGRQVSRSAVWGAYYKHYLRLLRRTATIWIVVLGGLGAGIASTFAANFPTDEDRQSMAAATEGVPAFEALFGRTVELATIEGFVLWRFGGFATVAVALWGLTMTVSLLRGAEETGHLEVLRSGAAGPRTILSAAVAAAFTPLAVFAVIIGAGHTAAGVEATTSWVFGAALALLGAVFAAIGAVSSQIAGSRRGAMSVGAGLLAAAVGLRVVAASTATPDWVWGLTPLGWMSYLHESDSARPQVFVGLLVTVVAFSFVASLLCHRDLGSGLWVGARGRQRGPGIGDHRSLVQWEVVSSARSWAGALAATGLLFGLLAEDFAVAMSDLPGTVELAERLGFAGLDTSRGVIASLVTGVTPLVLALFVAAMVVGLREQEASGRAEHLLSRQVNRTQWAWTRASAIAAAVVVLATITAVSAYVGALAGGASFGVADTLVLAANQLPLPVVFLGVGVLTFGLVPRATALVAYGSATVAYVVDLVGGVLDLPAVARAVSPFHHVDAAPVTDPGLLAAAVMVAGGSVAVWLGIRTWMVRDLAEF